MVDKVPNSASKTVFNLEDDDMPRDGLTFDPIYLSGTFTESNMNKVGYLIITLPSGVTNTKMVKTEFNDDLTQVNLSVQMPAFLTNSFLLHKHTFPDDGMLLLGTEAEVSNNLRITTYNKLLDSIGYRRGGSHLWHTSIILLPQPSCSKKFKAS